MGPKPTTLQRFDTRPPLSGTLYDAQGLPVNLTGATLTLDMRRRFARVPLKISGAAVTVLDALAGTFQYAWQAGDTDEPGEYDLWIRVDYGGGARESFPNKDSHRIVVRP